MATEKVAASEALRQLRQKLKTKPTKSTPLSLPLAMSNEPSFNQGHNPGGGSCTCRGNGSTSTSASNSARSHSTSAHFDAPPPPSPTSSHLHSLAMSTVGIPPGPTSPRSIDQVKEQMISIEEGLMVGTDPKKMSEDGFAKQLIAARKIRDLICTNRDDLIRELIDRKLIPKLMRWLHPRQKLEVQVEALWALTNFVAGASEHAGPLIKHGAVSALTQLLACSSQNVSKQVVWLLGSLAGGGTGARDAVISGGVLIPLVDCLERYQASRELLKVCAWALSKVCDGQTQGQQEVTKAMPVLSGLLQHPGADAETLSHACWAVSHLCDGPGAHVKAVVEAGAVWRLVELVRHTSWRVVKPALRTIGNIVCAEDDVDYTQHVIDVGAVLCLRQLIGHPHREIQKEACWTLSNIAAGTVEQIQTVLDNDCMPFVISLTCVLKDQEVKTEACWVVLNATSCGSDTQIEFLVELGCISVLADLLTESSMAMMALEGLERVLQVGDRLNRRERALIAAIAMKARDEDHSNDEKTSVLLERHLFGNPFAPLVPVAKLEALESNNNSLGKRAASIRKLYYVNCAICLRIFSRGSGETHFCNECQCDVCLSCNCVRFHLSFLQEQWGELEGQEKLAKEQLRLKKANKKKRPKDKKAKDNELNGQKSIITNKDSEKNSQSSQNTGTPSPQYSDLPMFSRSLPPWDSPPELQPSSNHSEEKIVPTPSVTSPHKQRLVSRPSVVNMTSPRKQQLASASSQTTKNSPGNKRADSKKATENGASPRMRKENDELKSNRRKNRTNTSPISQSNGITAENVEVWESPKLKINDSIEENEKFVNFLQKTGSILALAQIMDEQDEQRASISKADSPPIKISPKVTSKKESQSGHNSSATPVARNGSTKGPLKASKGRKSGDRDS